jgi:hypothetical protein
MATVTRTEARVKATRRNLKIDDTRGQGVLYRVEAIPIDPSIGVTAYRLHNRANGKTYDVHQGDDGSARCDCPDFEFRRADAGEPCKHIRALVEAGLLAELPHAAEPPPEPEPEPSITCPACSGSGHIANHGRCLVCSGRGTATAAERAEAGWTGDREPEPEPEPGPCEAPDPDDSDPDTWPAWTDLPALALLPPDEEVRLTLVEALEAIRRRFLDVDSDLADLVAESIGELVTEARITQARTVDQLRDRRAALAS